MDYPEFPVGAARAVSTAFSFALSAAVYAGGGGRTSAGTLIRSLAICRTKRILPISSIRAAGCAKFTAYPDPQTERRTGRKERLVTPIVRVGLKPAVGVERV
jgi:hypothetical protein